MKNRKKGFIAEFREFISKGSVTDLAVGVIIGSAFTAIVTSLVNDVLMPFIGLIVGGYDFSGLKIVLSPAMDGRAENAILYGSFLQSVVNFLVIAFVVFLLVKGINALRRVREREKDKENPAEAPKISEEVRLLTEIRDLLKK
ncbi:MAG: large-conductance mechanosensitive channel protein MscL [Christensenellales bacterium]